MFKLNFLLGWRKMIRQPLVSFINVFGLSIAIGCNVVILLFQHFVNTMDDFHKNYKNIYMVKSIIETNGMPQQWGITPLPLSQALNEETAVVRSSGRLDNKTVKVRVLDDTFYEYVQFADSSLIFNILTFEFLHSNGANFNHSNVIYISESLNKKYFPDPRNSIGQQIEIDYKGKKNSYTVSGVFKDFSNKASFKFNVLLPYRDLEYFETSDAQEWKRFTSCTFVLTDSPNSFKQSKSIQNDFVERQNAAGNNLKVIAYDLEPLSSLSLNAYKIRSSISSGFGNKSGHQIMVILGLFTLVLASINAVNISLANCTLRLKEIGLKKTVGVSFPQLVAQLLSESLLLAFIASSIGLILSYSLFIPAFDKLFSIGLMEIAGDVSLFSLYLIIMTIVTGILTGAYPAFYISSLNTVRILQQNIKLKHNNLLNRSFLMIQFTLSSMLIIVCFLFINNYDYLRNKDLGYDEQDLFVIHFENPEDVSRFIPQLLQLSSIQSVGESKNHIGRSRAVVDVRCNNDLQKVNVFEIGDGYFDVMRLKLVSGEKPGEGFTSNNNVLVNQTFLREFRINKIENVPLEIDSLQYNIIGVVNDFHYQNFNSTIEPCILKYNPATSHYLTLKINDDVHSNTRDQILKLWKQNFPDKPVNAFYQNELYQGYFSFIEGHLNIIAFISGVSIVISCLGLFGVISLTTNLRVKEFGIRKIQGATVRDLLILINKSNVILILGSVLIGLPAGYLTGNFLFESFYGYFSPFKVHSFLFASLTIFLMSIIPMSLFINKLRTINPIATLKTE